MPRTQSLARASSTPLPSASALPEGFLSSMTDEVAALRDVLDSYDLLESLLSPVCERPAMTSVGALLRILNAELTRRLVGLEVLLVES